MNLLDRPAATDSARRPVSRAVAVLRVLFASIVAALALWLGPQAPQASHATDGELLAWVEGQDGRDVAAGFVDAAVADRPHALVGVPSVGAPAPAPGGLADAAARFVAGACGTRIPTGLPAVDAIGCELPKTAGDVPELQPPSAPTAADAPGLRRTLGAPSDPAPRQAHLPRPLRPPTA